MAVSHTWTACTVVWNDRKAFVYHGVDGWLTDGRWASIEHRRKCEVISDLWRRQIDPLDADKLYQL